MKDDNHSSIFFGGIFAVIAIVVICLKAIEALFIEMGRTFYAFEIMAKSFVGAMWGAAQIAFFGALILSSIAAGIYFTYRYVQMVRNATEIQRTVDVAIHHFQNQMEESLHEFRSHISYRMEAVEHELQQALAVRTAVTMPPQETVKAEAFSESKFEPQPDPSAGISIANNQGDSNTPINTVTNPY